MIKLPPELDKFWPDRGYYGTVQAQHARGLPALYGLVRRQPVRPRRPAAGAGGEEIRRVHGRRGRGAGEGQGRLRQRRIPLGGDGAQACRVRQSRTARHGKDLLADTYEQLGYQAESGPWRSVYLQGAYELRNGVPNAGGIDTASPDTIRGMPPEMLFDYLGVRLERPEGGGQEARRSMSTSPI